ncbi:MAG: hypothetical protein OSB09_07415 [Planctomycetota bacterium]|nr:hypothetical protein [Planctomycetota bacterium]
MRCLLSSRWLVLAILCLLPISFNSRVQAQPCDPGGGFGGTGPDVMVGELTGTQSYGLAAGHYAYSVGTTSCNIGTDTLLWISNQNLHPVIGQNLYRLNNGRFEQIGMSWLKHGFLALAQNSCGCGCNNPGNGALLGVGCSDPYSSGLNGQQSGLGPRSEVIDPANGGYLYPISLNPPNTDLTAKRLRVDANDNDPNLNAGALYFVEGHYVTPDDAAAGNAHNNCSYRSAVFSTNATRAMTLTSSTQRQQPGIQAWQDNDPAVTLTETLDADNGLVILGYKVTDLGGGQHAYEYAIFNMNSTRAVASFEMPLAGGVSLTSIESHHPNYHSGEPYSTTPWSATQTAGVISWATQTSAQDVNANAIRWSSLHNFRFIANAPPTLVTATLGHFSGGASSTMDILAPSGDFTIPVSALSCTQSGEQVDLNWSNGELYDSIEISRDGIVLGTVAGSSTSYIDINPAPGTHQYGVNASVTTVPSGVVPCLVTVSAALSITVPGGDPTVFTPLGGETFDVVISPNPGASVQAGSEWLRIETGATIQSVPLVFVGGLNYQMTFPPMTCGAEFGWWIEAQSAGGQLVSYPEGGSTAPVAGISTFGVTLDVTDFEIASGWSVGAPNDATTGIWTRGNPIGTLAQPEDDHSVAGTQCWFTGQGAVGGSLGANDVDGGSTTLYSPAMDLTSSTTPQISYFRWYSNDSGASPGADVFVVQVSDDQATWIDVETVGPSGTGTSGGWIEHSFMVADFVLLTGNVQLRFTVSDLGAGSIVEAGIDDFRYEDVDCSGITDCNLNGVPDAQDIAGGTSLDCDIDGIPDECSTGDGSVADCNGNNIPDICDVATGTADCDQDGVPDSCEADTDGDGQIDDCDADLDGDGIPNVCDVDQTSGIDCDTNGQLDSCDLAAGAMDCDLNGQLDSCQISADRSTDCDLSGTLDSCEIAGGLAADCNGNAILDNCEIGADASLDCDTSGILDSCEISSGTVPDCNANGTPDFCDIAAGTSTDADANGEPDECAVQDWIRGDINVDGALDISDAVASLDYLFGNGVVVCQGTVDVNDDDAVNVADTVYLLGYMFASGTAPSAPFPACGQDPAGTVLSCDSFPLCP